MRRNTFNAVAISSGLLFITCSGLSADELWKRHVVHEGFHTNTAVAADFTGDGQPDVISNSDEKTRLFVGPNWREIIIDETPQHNFIHSEVLDIDQDGDPDFIGARYSPGLIAWLECPDEPTRDRWRVRVIDDQVNGVHGLLTGDVDQDGQRDLIANSGQPSGPLKNSAVWLQVPAKPKSAGRWQRHVFADHDAPGLSHYLGFGDVNGDGRPDLALAAKGGPSDPSGKGEWFAWWQASRNPKRPFIKHLLPGKHPGATNIQQADVNGDGKLDFIATRGHGHGVMWFENPTWEVHEINSDLEYPHCLQVVDLDGDGDMDAATCAYGSKVAAWFENDGRGNFETHIVARNQAAYDLRAADMDLDGDLDLLVAGQQSKNVVWLEQPE